MAPIGLCDTPLEPSDLENDFLGLDRYARALADFAEECATPITIALQGDWGSGKTSLMNLIRGQLSDGKKHCRCVWFNTWQYSQFGLENQLAVSLISFFINELLPGDTEDKISLKKTLAPLVGRVFSAVGAGVGGLPGAAISAVGAASSAALANSKDEETNGDPAACIADLKKKLTDLVKKTTENNERIIVFIDDLDRLPPARAVELLEAFKLFLDIRGCVFFLACDYKVINQGLKAKFGEEIAGNNEKSFFDKIIQLPFKMPVLQYEVKNYIGNLLEKIGIEYEDSDIEKYHDLIETSIGFNPRGLKRAFNTLLLLKRVADVEDNPDSDADNAADVDQNEKDRLLFAIICMQFTYEFFYKLVYKFNTPEDIVSLFDKLQALDKHTKDEDISALLKEMPTEHEQKRFKKFIEALFKAMQLDFDGKDEELTEDEAQVFRNMLELSQVTSMEDQDTGQEEQDYDLREVNKAVCKKLTGFLNEKCRLLKKKKLVFRHDWHRGTSDMEVMLNESTKKLSWMGISLGRTGKPRTPYYFSIEAGLYVDSPKKDFETLHNLLKEAMPEDKTIDDLRMDVDDSWGPFISLCHEEHNSMNDDELYQKIQPIANKYFDVLLRT